MKVVKPQKLGILTRCFERERHQFLSVGILALHGFSSALSSEADMWKFLPEELGKDGIPDAGMPKSRAEFLVTGNAFQPGGKPWPGCKVRVQLGAIGKTLYVFGDRYWLSDAEQTNPHPFGQMPITWENAFGGEGFDRNPLGKGFVPVETAHGLVHPLPNVEHPGILVRSKKDRPEPAGLGPIDLMWPQRFSKAGTHDERWLKERFPGFAEDMDWSIFNIASEDQQQREPFRGDEQFVIEGMHPEKHRLKGSLPGMATRCFINQRTSDRESFREIGMRLTTVWLFPHAERYLLIFHGTHEVAEDDAADVSQLMVGAEALGEPKPFEHYQKVLEQRLDPEKGAIHSLRDSDLLPSTPEINAALDESTAEIRALLETEGLRRKHLRVKINREIEERRAFLVGLGLDPDIHGPALLPPDEPHPSLEELPQLAEKMKEEAERKKEEMEQRKTKLKEEVRPILEAEGLDANAILSEPDQPVFGPPTFSAEAVIEDIRTLSAECVAMGCPVKELDEYAMDSERRQMLFDTEKNMREGYRQMAHHQDAAPRFSVEEAAQTRAAVIATLDSHGSLARLNMTGFDLSDMNLRGVDLSEAWLENANLTRANLEGANLTRAVLARADLTEANLTRADLAKANLGLAQIIRTNADGTNLSEAILNKAQIEGASLRGARLDSADLLEATLSDSDLSEATLCKLNFLKTDLNGLRFAGADLSGCNFLQVNFRSVDFSSANLESVTFVKSKGEGVIFSDANMKSSRFVQECAFEQADFRRAVLEDANLRGTRLAGSDFSEARLAGADLSECDLSRTRFYRAFARNALFAKAKFSDAVLVSADLMNAILQKADLSRADLRGANLFQADLSRVHADWKTNFRDANAKKVRIYPKRAAS